MYCVAWCPHCVIDDGHFQFLRLNAIVN
uniref:Uncharacterized protein n=1 Tax=Tetranychus urticae TaxID=32264 RepID=T1KE13_TETUR